MVLAALLVLQRLAPVDRQALTESIQALRPGGFTPIGRALELAVLQLPADTEAAIVVLPDGEDTCGDPTPCEAARANHDQYPKVAISTVGFKTDDVDQLVSRLVAAYDAAVNAGTITPTGHLGVELGQHVEELSRTHPYFPALSGGRVEGDLVIIHWMDCDWAFRSDGTLTEIRLPGRATVDGLTVGAPAARAVELYGEPVRRSPSSDGGEIALYPASRQAGTAWKITSDAAGTVRTIVLCRCLPGAPAAAPAGPSPRAGARSSDGGGLPADPPGGLSADCAERVHRSAEVPHPWLGTVKVFLLTDDDASSYVE